EPLSRVSPQQFGELWRQTARHLGDEFFGLGRRPAKPGAYALLQWLVKTVLTRPAAESAPCESVCSRTIWSWAARCRPCCRTPTMR
ncbi:MAG: hypothetical protein EOP73_28085, partial [Variovorax sp.]